MTDRHKFNIKTAGPTPEKASELKSMMTRLGIGEDTVNMKTLNAISRLFESREFARYMKKEFDRSFDVTVDEKGGKVRVQFAVKDSGHSVMTIGDVAVFLQTDRASVRRMTGERAQRRSHHPIPYVKLGGKMLRFNRPDIERWWSEVCQSPNGKNNTSALALSKGKSKK
jgi:Helix-turn-helix domain